MKAGDGLRRSALLRGLLLAASVVVCWLVAVAPALAGSTSESTLTKTGTDATSGSVGSTAGKVGKTAAGDTLNWVLSYTNTTGSPANVKITDPISGNQTFVPGSLKVPGPLSAEWSTNGGSSYVATEPGSGVNAVGATGLLPSTGLGAAAPFAPITTASAASTGTGDGFQDVFYNGDVYNIHHHYVSGEIDPSGAVMTLLDCHVVATGQECPGYAGGGLDANTTVGSSFFANGGGTSNFTTASQNGSAFDPASGRLYFPAQPYGSTAFGLGCLNLSNNTSCGFVQFGTSGLVGGAGPGYTFIEGGTQIGSKYYTFAQSGTIYCYDVAAQATCGTFPSGFANNPPYPDGNSAIWNFDQSRYLFTSRTDGVGNIYISCTDLTTSAVCPGFAKVAVGAGGFLLPLPVLDSSGTLTGICAENEVQGNTGGRPVLCFSVNGATTIPNPYPIPAASEAWGAVEESTVVQGTKVFYDDVTGTAYEQAGGSATYQYECADFSLPEVAGKAQPCAGFNSPPKTIATGGTGDLRTYTLRPDPQIPGCIGEDGDGGVIQYFSATTGALSCSGDVGNVSVNPAAGYCDGASGHVTGWNQVSISGIPAADYGGATVTVYDANGSPITGFTNVPLSSSQMTLDISSIPASGSTARLSVAVSMGTPPAGVTPVVSLTYKGDPVQVCFSTKVGKASCNADESISNSGNAVTSASGGASDAPGGDNSGDATFTLPADPTNSACQADLTVNKSASSPAVYQGGQVVYTLVVQNKGPDTATDAVVSDPIPAGLGITSVIPTQGSCTSAGSIQCSLGTIKVGGAAQILVTASVSTTAPTGTLNNCATVSAFQVDPVPGNNGSCVPVIIDPPPPPPPPLVDLQIIKHVSKVVAVLGKPVTYTIDVINHGPSTAPDVKVNDTSVLPLHPISIKPSQGTCTSGEPFSCDLGEMKNGATVTIKVVALPKQTGSQTNWVTVTEGCMSSQPNCVPPPNKCTHGCISHAHNLVDPYITLTKIVNRHVVNVGENVTYHIKVADPTPVAVKNVTVCDKMPTGLIYRSSAPRAHLSVGRYCWTIAKLAGHGSKTFEVIATVTPLAPRRMTNTATARAPHVPPVPPAHTTVIVRTPPPVPCGIASAASAGRGPTAHAAC